MKCEVSDCSNQATCIYARKGGELPKSRILACNEHARGVAKDMGAIAGLGGQDIESFFIPRDQERFEEWYGEPLVQEP